MGKQYYSLITHYANCGVINGKNKNFKLKYLINKALQCKSIKELVYITILYYISWNKNFRVIGTLTKKNKSAFSDICLRSFDFFNYFNLLKVNLLCFSLTTILLTTIVLEMKSKMFLFGIFCKHCGRETKQNVQYIQNQNNILTFQNTNILTEIYLF